MGASTFALVVFAVLSSDLIAEFGVERWQVGALVTATTVGGALVSPMIGSLVDRFGARPSTVMTLFLSAATLAGIALSPTFSVLAFAALLSGLVQAISNPATNKLIALHVPAGKRGAITGIKQSGVQVGTFLGGLLLPAVAIRSGWRTAVFVFVGIWTLGGVLALATLEKDPVASDSVHDPVPARLPSLVWRLAAYGFVLGFGGTAVFTYLPLFSQEALEYGKETAGFLAAFLGLVGIGGRIGWGRIAEGRLGAVRSLRIIAVLAMLAGLLMVGAVSVPWLVWPAAIITGLSASSWNSVGMLSIIQSVPASVAGKSSGVVLFGFMLGLGVGAPAFGYSVDRLGTYTPGWIGITVVFALGLLIVGSEEVDQIS